MTDHSKALGIFAKVVVFATLVLLLVGGKVTTAGAGMAVETAPTVHGVLLNPPGWTEDPMLLREHGHRLIAMTVALLTAILCAWMWKNFYALLIAGVVAGVASGVGTMMKLDGNTMAHIRIWPAAIAFVMTLLVQSSRRKETNSAERWMTIIAFCAVCVQAIMGSMRVTWEAAGQVDAATTLRIIHGCFAQAFLGLVVVIAARLSPVWRELETQPKLAAAAKFQRMAWVAAGLYFFTLILAAYLRHKGLGLVIPTWPGAGRGLLPPEWSHAVGIHFLHSRVLPFLILGHVIGLTIGMAKRSPAAARLSGPGWTLLGLILLQIILGMLVIWKGKHPHITNTHVINGALIFATIMLLVARTGKLREPAPGA